MGSNTILHKCIRHSKWLMDSINGYFKFKKIIDSSSYIFISHNGDSAGGAPVVLFELMCSMNDGKNMVFLCEKPGGIIKMCKDVNIPAFSTYLIQKKFLKAIVVKKVKVVVVNTLAASSTINMLSKMNSQLPIFWWIHEENNLILKYKTMVPKTLPLGIQVLCVSERVETDLLEVIPMYKGRTKIFFYGCRDLYTEDSDCIQRSDKFTVSVIGRICSRKNQIQVIDAYINLTEELKGKIQINFVAASYDNDYIEEMKERIGKISNINFTGPIARESMPKIYRESDLIICSSIDDPLPVVITEAMMLKRPFITSSKTGQYSIVNNGINGFSYNVDFTEELTRSIIDVYYTKDIESIAGEARKTYLRYFTPEIVRENFEKLIKQLK